MLPAAAPPINSQLAQEMAINEEEIFEQKEKETKQILPFRRVDSLDVESNKVSGMALHDRKVLTTALILQLAYQSIGIVFGDVGTSPLYVYSSTFSDGIKNTDDVLGAMSLIFYTLTLLPLIKYVFIVLYATDNGDGSTFALYSVIKRHARVGFLPNYQAEDQDVSTFLRPDRKCNSATKLKEVLENSKTIKIALLLTALAGTSMVIGDGVFIPSISVLAALGGVKEATPKLGDEEILIMSIAILVVLFSVQQFGTSKVGIVFPPIVLTWFGLIGSIGVYNILKHDPRVFRSLNPKHIYNYFARDSKSAWISLGGIVLSTTGTEIMFADVGHFSVVSIQIAFTVVVYPCLLLAYFGQTAYLRKFPDDVSQCFYRSIPSALFWPQFVVAMGAAIIASQAMISATFTIIQQSMSLGCFPRVKVVHTSSKAAGQVYIPEINWALMIASITLTASFKTKTEIGHAHGTATVAIMLVTTCLIALIMILVWHLRLIIVLGFLLVFGTTEMVFLSSVLYKFTKAGYLPALFGGVLLFIMCVWYYVTTARYCFEVDNRVSGDALKMIVPKISRVEGVALVYTELVQGIPYIFSHMVDNLPALHSLVVFVSVKFLPVPKVLESERFLVRRVGEQHYHMYRCVARYGYSDLREPNDVFQRLLLLELATFISYEAMEGSVSIYHQDGASMRFGMQEGTDEPQPLNETEEVPAGDEGPDAWLQRARAWARSRSVSRASRHSQNHSRRQSSSSIVPVDELELPKLKHSRRQSSISTNIFSFAQGAGAMAYGRSSNLQLIKDPAMRADLREELRILRVAYTSGVVYLVGHSDVRASRSSPLLRRFIVNYAYEFLRKNVRRGAAAFTLPPQKTLEVGMVYYI